MSRLLFVIRSLAGGGAERQLCVLAKELADRQHQVTVLVFRRGGPYDAVLTGSNVELTSVDKSSTWETARFFFRVIQVVRRVRPDIVYGFLDLGNLVATLVSPFAPTAKLAWGVRVARLDLRQYDLLARLVNRLCRALSRQPDFVICNSEAGAADCTRMGYPAGRIYVVPNGIDCDRFAPDPAGAERFRREYRIPASAPVVGLVARLDPVKDHQTFIAAASTLAAMRPDVRFVCVGDGDEPYRSRILELFADSGLGDRLVHAPFTDDVVAVHSALDVATSCSLAEGFSNTIAEAMACGVPCVATDVGDSRQLIGETGIIVPVSDPIALASAWQAILLRDRQSVSRATRARVLENFGVGAMVARTLSVLQLDPDSSLRPYQHAP